MSTIQLIDKWFANHWWRVVVVGAALVLLVGCARSDMQDLVQYVAAVKASSSGKKLEPLPEVEPYVPFEYTAEGLKDPFVPSAFVKEAEVAELASIDSGIRPDPDRPREELEKYSLGSLRMVGTYIKVDEPEGDLWALIKAPDGIIHRIRQGNYMGNNHGKISNINEQRIDLREIVPNSRTGGWEERDAFLSLTE